MARLIEYNPRELHDLVTRHVRELTTAVLQESVRTCPVGNGPDAGSLKASLRMDVAESSRSITGRVYTDLDYAIYVHEGRGPVRARHGHVLGPLPSPYPRFVKRVAAADPQPWLLNALKDVSPYPVTEGR